MAFDLATAKPAGGGGFDLATAKPVEAVPFDVPTPENLQRSKEAAQRYAKETEGVTLPFGNKLVGDAESALSVGTGLVSSIVGPAVGLAKNIFGRMTNNPDMARGVERDAVDVMHGMTYSPRTKVGRDNLDMLAKIIDKTKIAGLGPAEAGMLAGRTGGLRPSVKVPGVSGEKPAATPKRGPGVGAEKAVNEMQRQSVVAEAPTRGEAGLSARENVRLELDEATKPLRDKAFASDVRVNMGEPLSLIERMKSQTNNPNVIKALDQAKSIIEDGIAKNKPAAPASGRMSAAEFKAMQQQGAQGTMSVKMLDETRQAINDIINGVGQGEKPYGAFAQKELLAIQESMLKFAPKEYQQYLSEYAQRAQKLEPFQAAGSAMSKVTTDPAVFNTLNRADKQALIEKVFTDKTPGRGLSELVRDTAHNPEAAKGLRAAYTDWLTTPDPKTQAPRAGEVIKKWSNTREAVKSSKLMTDEHIASMDKIVDDIRVATEGGSLKKAWASTAGFIMFAPTGHPIVGAHAVRDVVSQQISKSNAAALERAVMQIAGDPEGAAALAARPTPANVERVRLMLPTDLAAVVVPAEAREQQTRQPQRGKRLMSMQPAGL